jgi:hypothetical protein
MPPSLEPILFPKLRIYFADFPYLHSSLNYRLLTLETCCGLWYGYRRDALCANRIFTRVLLRSTYAENQHTLVHLLWPISEQVHSRSICALRRKDNSSVGQQYLSPETLVLPPIETSFNSSGISTRFPFARSPAIAGDCNQLKPHA